MENPLTLTTYSGDTFSGIYNSICSASFTALYRLAMPSETYKDLLLCKVGDFV